MIRTKITTSFFSSASIFATQLEIRASPTALPIPVPRRLRALRAPDLAGELIHAVVLLPLFALALLLRGVVTLFIFILRLLLLLRWGVRGDSGGLQGLGMIGRGERSPPPGDRRGEGGANG